MQATATKTTYSPITKRNVKGIKFADLPTIQKVSVRADFVVISLSDGRIVMMPISWSEKLQNASIAQRKKISKHDYFIFWEEIDEIIGIKNILYGQKLWL